MFKFLLALIFTYSSIFSLEFGVDQNTVALWHFNEGSGTTLTDVSGNGNNGTISGATWVDGIEGKALDFNGTNSLIIIPNSSTISNNSEITIELWAFIRATTTQMLFENADGGGTVDAAISLKVLNNDKMEFFVGNGTTNPVRVHPVTDLTSILNKWIYIACTYDGNIGKGYINGKLVAQDTRALSIKQTTTSYAIGDFPGYNQYLNGKMEEFRISSVARTASEIAAHWEANKEKATTIAHWDFNDGTGTTLTDKSVYGNHGTINGATWVNGIEGRALSFDGLDDFVDLGSNLFSSNEGTISAWVQYSSATGHFPIFSQGQINIRDVGVRLAVWDNIFMYVFDDRRCTNDLNSLSHNSANNDTLLPNTWSHVAVTSNGSNYQLFLDGKAVQFEAGGNSVGGWFADLCSGTQTDYIGRWKRDISDDFFKGIIDNLKIHNRALDANEILNLYNFNSNNNPPQFITEPSNNAFQDSLYVSAAVANDLDGDNLTYAFATGPSGMTINNSGVINWTPTSSDIGVETITVTVTDSRGGFDTLTYDLTVNNVNDIPTAPVLIAPNDGANITGDNFMMWKSSTDPDAGDTLQYMIEFGSNSVFDSIYVSGNVTDTISYPKDIPNITNVPLNVPVYWRVKAVDQSGGESDYSEVRLMGLTGYGNLAVKVSIGVPRNTFLHAMPNPFSPPATIIYFGNVDKHNAKLRIFNLSGKLVAEFEGLNKGSVKWLSGNQPSGIFIANLVTGKKTYTRKIILLK